MCSVGDGMAVMWSAVAGGGSRRLADKTSVRFVLGARGRAGALSNGLEVGSLVWM